MWLSRRGYYQRTNRSRRGQRPDTTKSYDVYINKYDDDDNDGPNPWYLYITYTCSDIHIRKYVAFL